MKQISKHITLDREECLSCSVQEVIAKIEAWMTERYDVEKFYQYFRWEVDCHHMAACAVDDAGRIVFILELDNI